MLSFNVNRYTGYQGAALLPLPPPLPHVLSGNAASLTPY